MWVAIFFTVLLTSLGPVTSTEDTPSPAKQIRILENQKTDIPMSDIENLFDLPPSTNNLKLLKLKLLRMRNGVDKVRHKWLYLQSKSGPLKLRRPLDREELCSDEDLCIIHLEIFAVDLRQVLNLDVVIEDVNDNAPVFPVSRIVLNVSESAQVNDIINLNEFLAQDIDLGSNGEISYTISSNQFFRLQEFRDSSGIPQLQLKIIHKLDHETAPFQRLTMTARDHGTPSLSSHVDVIVAISDVNDNDPVFEKKEYVVTWPENMYAGQLIAQLQATDADSENSGLLRYSLSRRNKEIARQLLHVDPVTGDVTLKDTLDREQHDKMRVLIEARDSGSTNQRVGSTWLQLNVEDINDNYPQIEVNFLDLPSRDNTVYLNENSTTSTYLAYVTSKDADFGRNGKTELKIHCIRADKNLLDFGTALDGTFVLTKAGFLSLNKTVDRETIDQYDVEIQACDKGNPPKCSTKVIAVQLLDINDNPPIFNLSVVNLHLSEDLKVGSLLTKINARDMDSLNSPILFLNERGEVAPSPYGEIMYHIIDGDGSLDIDPQSGTVVLARSLDREMTDRFEVTVRAKDGGRKGALQSTCKIYVTVGDVNDNSPIVLNPQLDNVSIYATILRDDVILQVQAIDYDLDENGTVVYEILTENGQDTSRDNLTSLFWIDVDSGDLRLNFSNKNLNQSLGRQSIVVQASDKGTVPLRSNRIIEVVITDLEELPHAITSRPSLSSSQVLVVILSCAVTSFFIMLGTLMLLLWKCRNKTRASPAPRIKNYLKDSRSESYVVATAFKLEEPEAENRLEQESTEDIQSQMSKTLASYDNHSDENKQSMLKPNEQKLDSRRHYATLSTTSHDGDSGRGDSDPDAPASDVIQDFVHQLRTSPQPFNNQCTDQCLVHGHSDACWMPNLMPTTRAHTRSPSPYYRNNIDSPMYVEISRIPSNAYYNPCHNYNLERVATPVNPLVIGHLPAWNYPANELSSIYSDVIITQQKRHCSIRPPIGENPQRSSPASCFSSPPYIPPYTELATENSKYRKSPLSRSVSVDQLKKSSSALLSSLYQEPSSPKIRTGQKLSMRETEDIVQGIEKLLD